MLHPDNQKRLKSIPGTGVAVNGPDGKIVRKPMMTVRHNGILTHKDQALPGKTTAAAASGHIAKDSLMLQDHGNKVRYRNVWVVVKED